MASKSTEVDGRRPTKISRGAPPYAHMFEGTCDGLKGRGIIFDSADPRADRFIHVKREISE